MVNKVLVVCQRFIILTLINYSFFLTTFLSNSTTTKLQLTMNLTLNKKLALGPLWYIKICLIQKQSITTNGMTYLVRTLSKRQTRKLYIILKLLRNGGTFAILPQPGQTM